MAWQTIGFGSIKRYFDRMIKEGALDHAHVFTGQERIGKRTLAVEVAGKLAESADMMIVGSDESAISIDTIREAKRFLSLSPLHGARKVLIIDDAWRMTEEAQNALLKVLEEPNASSHIFLVTPHADALLPTITSRCHTIPCTAPEREVFEEVFASRKLSAPQHDFLYRFSNGSVGLVRELLANGALTDIKKYAEELAKLLKAGISTRLEMVKQLADDDELPKKVLTWLMYLHAKPDKDTRAYAILQGLTKLHQTIGQSQYNRQLAIENFVLGLDHGYQRTTPKTSTAV